MASSDHVITKTAEIPAAALYVVMRDRFLSDWGPAEGKDAIFVAPCQSGAEAEYLLKYARSRSDTDHIRVRTTKPRPDPRQLWMLMVREECPAWYGIDVSDS